MDTLVHKAFRAQKVPEAILVLKAPRVIRVILDLLVHRVRLVTLDQKVCLALQAHRAMLVILVAQAPRAIAGFTRFTRSDQGDRGLTGSQGQQGGQGYTGSQGGLGDQGYDGSKGDPGARGFSGSQGAPGSDATVNPTDYVQRNIGGDDMQGPFNVKGHSGDSRSTSRIQALGLFSGSSSSALRLGTTGDRVYIDSENTQFNGGIMVNNIGPKTQDGRGVTLNIEGTNDKHLVTKSYVDSKLADGGGGGDYVSTVDGEQSMLGPLEIHSLGGWKASRVKLQYVTTKG